MVTAVVGANWGDEGKGKVTDRLAAQSDLVVRYQGGGNAGHTIRNQYGKFALHLLPSGVFHSHILNIIGNGVAVNIPLLVGEIEGLVKQGVPRPNLMVSDRAQIVMPYHILQDKYEEERLGSNAFGSTQSGIAPFYSDKYLKVGVQICELNDLDAVYGRLERLCVSRNALFENLYNKPALDPRAIVDELKKYRDMIAPYVGDSFATLDDALKRGKSILVEGQLGALRDPDFGIYPFTTSSNTLAGYASAGAGIPPYAIRRIVAVVKAYSSAVGAGAFVSEVSGEAGDELRRRGGDGGEYGATTGRPRRMGWFDVVASRYGCRLQGATEAVLTVVDALGYLDEIPVCVSYELNGKRIDRFPNTHELNRCRPVLETLPGWKCDIQGIRDYDDLPGNCRRYIEFIEEGIGTRITMVSNGPGRDEMIIR